MSHTERLTQSEKALMGLRALLFDGAFEPNTRLSEVAVANRLGISRTPLRQAMSQLVDEGFLERIETGGCRVASFTMEDILDAIEIRGVVEGTAARLAAERGASTELLTECREVLARLDKAVGGQDRVDFDTYVHCNAEFHRLISCLAGSAVVAREVERVSRLPLASPSAFLQGQELVPDFQASLRLAQFQHWAIFEAIESREGGRAEAMAREHARLARRNLKFLMNKKPNLIDKVPGLALVAS